MFDVQWYGGVWYGLLTQLNETVMALIFVEPLRAPSRASPLPQGIFVDAQIKCGSEPARESYLPGEE
ncbi:hypothetical protein VC34_15555 [Pseudomonas fluorescens]|uniref:Uncharacterized protein n=1 Tax=Pseudomonas fluorescens TaxID=294 RepID=A0A0F4TE80_PSEFL|nr:hypothetical protein VC34_15555 [Pseudomonas fluorescens]